MTNQMANQMTNQKKILYDYFNNNEEASDTIDWIFEFLNYQKSKNQKSPQRALFALIAAVLGIRLCASQNDVEDFLLIAFLELNESMDSGFKPFENESSQYRMIRFQKNIERIRSGFSESDHGILMESRLQNFDDR